ncbi:MAG: 2-hydroxychromene-2-carboxylate isomerase [Sandaracinus sp.]|nr:2-hydroxychromene-2-carboxylate isomerase [Sandaracinus sp.]MCB9633933.1 2-hydroxychromene-2-carboxylate isomerase [Sandaracinus sp.]
MARHLEIFFDVVSPYSYLATTQIDALAARHDAEVQWRPFFLGGVMKATGNQPPAMLPARAPYLLKDIHRWAAKYDVPLTFPKIFPANTLMPQRMLAALELEAPDDVRRLAAGFFSLYWAEGGDPTASEVLVARANELGFEGPRLLAAAGRDDVKEQLKASTDEAVRRGAFGAPSIFFEGEMYFGNDRLVLLEDALDRSKV